MPDLTAKTAKAVYADQPTMTLYAINVITTVMVAAPTEREAIDRVLIVAATEPRNLEFTIESSVPVEFDHDPMGWEDSLIWHPKDGEYDLRYDDALEAFNGGTKR